MGVTVNVIEGGDDGEVGEVAGMEGRAPSRVSFVLTRLEYTGKSVFEVCVKCRRGFKRSSP